MVVVWCWVGINEWLLILEDQVFTVIRQKRGSNTKMTMVESEVRARTKEWKMQNGGHHARISNIKSTI